GSLVSHTTVCSRLEFPLDFFLLSLPPPPRSPLFPYTTLFRSHGARARGDRRAPRAAPSRGVRGGAVLGARGGGAHGAESASPLRDRKSTRLNSSHVAISYAVFCLKKKKIRKRIGETEW